MCWVFSAAAMPTSGGEPCLEEVEPLTGVGDRCVRYGAIVVPLAALGFEQAKVWRFIIAEPDVRQQVGGMALCPSNIWVDHVNFRIVGL